MPNPVVQGVQLHSVSTAYGLPVEQVADGPRPARCDKKEISWQAVYYHFRKWSADGSLERVWQASIQTVRADLDVSELNLDGSHALAKKGGESVAYQGPSAPRPANPALMDANGYILASTGIMRATT
jgi:hypothetical protein